MPLHRLLVLAAIPLAVHAQARPARDSAARPPVLVVATGGTIAGVQDAPGSLGGYRAGTLTAEQIVASVPQLAAHARIETLQFANVASPQITTRQWIGLARTIDSAFRARPDLAGIVVTHGTDRLEETAFFLYLTVRSERPVVVVGAQRPATGISADGPMNLLSAVRTATSPAARDKGVLVVMDERIISAREVRKLYPRVGGFSGGEMGMLGVVARDGPEFFFAPTRRHGSRSEFVLDGVDSLPTVELVASYPGGRGPQFAQAPAGLVTHGTAWTCAESGTMQQLMRAGTVVVSAFASGEGVDGPREARDSVTAGMRRACPELEAAGLYNGPWLSSLGVQHLTPAKARILLMLALSRTRDVREVQRIFVSY
jgi:L-asparaginase